MEVRSQMAQAADKGNQAEAEIERLNVLVFGGVW